MRHVVVIGAVLLGLTTPAVAQPAKFELTVSPLRGTMDDDYIATVRVEVRGVAGVDRFFSPGFGDFRVADQRTHHSTQIIEEPRHGREIRFIEVRRYLLKPTRPGKLRIEPARVLLEGREFQTRAVVVEVTGADPDATDPGDAPGGPPLQARGRTFIHVTVDKTQVYVGEQVTSTWKIYTRSDILKFQPRPPRLDGFWSETLFEPKSYLSYDEEVVDGRAYETAILTRRALFPTRHGKVVIPAFEADVSTMHTSLAAPARLKSPPVTIDVTPLPPGAPAGFDPSYVGSFTVEASLDRRRIEAGESATLELVVSGAGAIRRTPVPELAFSGVEVYPPRDFQEEIDVSSGVVQGRRRYKYLLTPREGGTLALGAVEIPYFDPSRGRYDVAQSAALSLEVEGDPTQVALAAGGGSRDNVIQRDIRPLKEAPAQAARVLAYAYRSSWFWIFLLLPPVGYVVVVVVDRVRQRLRRETPRARLRRARGKARKRLRIAEIHLRGNRGPKFFGELARVLTDHLEEKLGEPVVAMTRDELGVFLARKGLPPDTVEAIVDELENCDYARFAPAASGPGEMKAALRRVQELLKQIERARTPAKSDEEAAA